MAASDIKTGIDGAVAYLTAHPEEARYTDSAATAVLREGLHAVVAGPDGARIETDMPASVGGGGVHPSPGWYLRAAIGSCVATLFAMRAATEGLTFDEVRVVVDSESDDRGILGIDRAVPAGPLSTRIAIAVSGAADPGSIRGIADWAVAHCPVSDAVSRAVPVSVEIGAT